jgi:hypothetical protein
MRNITAGFWLAAVCTLLAHAADRFWDTKPAAQWTVEEIRRLTTDSPWAKKVRSEAPSGGTQHAPVAAVRSVSTDEAIRTHTTPRVGGTILPTPEKSGTGGLAFYGEAVVRWESAEPIALANKLPFPDEFAGHYALSISGLPQQLVTAMISGGLNGFVGTNLTVQGRTPVIADFVLLTTDKRFLVFAIPKNAAEVRASDKTATFTMTCKGFTLKARFEPKEMTFRGRLAL